MQIHIGFHAHVWYHIVVKQLYQSFFNISHSSHNLHLHRCTETPVIRTGQGSQLTIYEGGLRLAYDICAPLCICVIHVLGFLTKAHLFITKVKYFLPWCKCTSEANKMLKRIQSSEVLTLLLNHMPYSLLQIYEISQVTPQLTCRRKISLQRWIKK